MQTLSESLNVPFPLEVIERVLSQQLKRRSELSLELLAALCEVLGLQTRMGAVRRDQLTSLEFPAIILSTEGPFLLHASEAGYLIVADPRKGLARLLAKDFIDGEEESFRVLLVSRNETTKTDRFDWKWFLPLIVKYRTSLLIVVAATFAIQMATLGIPLLMQQIIDKTLAQGNISSLNVLGSAFASSGVHLSG